MTTETRFILSEKLSKEEWAELTEIFTEPYMQEVESACRRYLYFSSRKTPGFAEDGKCLNEVGEKARELRQLLKNKQTKSALDHMCFHMSKEFKKYDTRSFVEDLKEHLRILEGMCFVTPAADRARNPKRGRPPKSMTTPEDKLAYFLWDIFKQAHEGKPASRVVDYDTNEEIGELVWATEILMPVLGLKSNCAKTFRKIGENYKKSMDKK